MQFVCMWWGQILHFVSKQLCLLEDFHNHKDQRQNEGWFPSSHFLMI